MSPDGWIRMFTGSDPALQSLLRGLLAAAAALYALGTAAIVIAIRAEPARARFYARLAGIARIGPFLVGCACLGLMMDAIDLRSGHEADVMSRWPALLPQVAALSAGAAFLAGLLAGARPVGTAFAAGGPMAFLSALVWVVAAWFLAALEREEGGVVSELRRSAPQSFRSFFMYLVLFPLVTIVVAGAGASLGRLLHGLLGLPADEKQGGRAPAAPTTAPAVPTVPSWHVPAIPAPASPTPPSPAPAPPESDTAPTSKLPPLALPFPAVSTARWPSVLLMAFGALMMIPAGCGLLMQRSLLVATDPAGGVFRSAPPSDVTLTFSDELSPSSSVTAHRTVTLDGTGQQLHTGGTPVADATGPSALGADRRTLRVRLPDGMPGGLYVVEWTAIRTGSRAERHGDVYFGVGMPVPDSIRNGGAPVERDPGEEGRREALAGGIMMILLGLAGRWYANELQGR